MLRRALDLLRVRLGSRRAQAREDARSRAESVARPEARKVHRLERNEVFHAYCSGDIERMVRALDIPTNDVDRHFLLMVLVAKTYQRRKDAGMAALCGRVAALHLEEFPRLAEALRSHFGELPRVSTFQHYATLLCEQGRHAQAIEVCQIAIGYELHDNTLSGFEGRIERIRKAASKREAG